MSLQKYVDIVNPLARSLWSLESPQANAADVYIFWIAIIATLKDLFSQNKKETFIGNELARKVMESHDNRRVTLHVSKEARQPRTPLPSFLTFSH